MAYVVAADFREGAGKAWTRGLTLTEDQVSDAELAALIAAEQDLFDALTDDHFEPSTAETIYLDGLGNTRLYFRKRIRAITSIATLQSDGTYSIETATNYTIWPSLEGTGASFKVDLKALDVIEVAPSKSLVDGSTSWSSGAKRIKVIGDFGWPTDPGVPTLVKRAVAMLVWNVVEPVAGGIRRASSWETPTARFVAGDGATGLDDVDRLIVPMYKRTQPVLGSF